MEDRGPKAGDDRVIAVAFRRSLAVVAVLAIAVAAFMAIRARRPAEVVRAKHLAAPAPVDRSAPERPRLPFTDVTRAAGIDFVPATGAAGEHLLPETMGSGVAVLDFDSDGDPDLLLLSARPWPWQHAGSRTPTPHLYANDGSGRFTDVTHAAGLDHSLYGMGAAVGDVDGDGDPDLFLTALGADRLLRNDGGRFVDVTAAAGVAGSANAWSTAAGFFDADGDGDLDLLVCHYVEWSRALDLEANFTLDGVHRAYGPPMAFAGTALTLYRNDGGWRFTDVTATAGMDVVNPASGAPVGKALGLTFADVDGDGLLDVLVANDTVRNFLFRNLGAGRFREVGTAAGVAFDRMGAATGAMGVDAGDLRGDGRLAFAIGNFANQMSSLYVAQGEPWQFEDEAMIEGLGGPSRRVLTFGLLLLDVDLDGRLDLLEANGHLEPDIARVQASQSYRQPAQLFWNAGPDAPATFIEVPAEELGDLARPMAARAAAYADLDGDGDLDLVLTANGGPPRVLRNDQATGHHWLRVRLHGAGANREAIGAELELTVGGRVLRRRQVPTRSYLAQVEQVVTFGLGDAVEAGPLRVRWPGGGEQEVAVTGVDRTLVVTEGG